jgi:transcriptional regulator with XRE-family HTH domain
VPDEDTSDPTDSGQTERSHIEHERLAMRLRDAREYLGLSQEFVAERLGIPRPSISAMETAKRKVSSLELRDLARLYKQPLSYFLAESSLPSDEEGQTVRALFRTAKGLTEEDRQQLLKFAQFLKAAGRAPTPAEGSDAESK